MTGGIQTDGLLQSAFQNANFFTLEDDSLFFLLDVSLLFFIPLPHSPLELNRVEEGEWA